MSKIDKIIQILDKGDGDILGLSESGKLYELDGNWKYYNNSPVVDNSACEVDEVSKYDIPSVSSSAITKEHFGNFLKRPK